MGVMSCPLGLSYWAVLYDFKQFYEYLLSAIFYIHCQKAAVNDRRAIDDDWRANETLMRHQRDITETSTRHMNTKTKKL